MNDVKHTLTIELTNSMNDLDKIPAALDQIAETIHCSPKKLCEINLIVEELFTNIVAHGIDDDADHVISICFIWDDREMSIRIEDDGKPFNPITVPVPDTGCALHDRCIGGLGIHLVRHFMDACDYMRKQGKNIMMLKKLFTDSACCSLPDSTEPDPDTSGQTNGNGKPDHN